MADEIAAADADAAVGDAAAAAANTGKATPDATGAVVDTDDKAAADAATADDGTDKGDEAAKPDWRAEAAGENKDLLRLAKRYGSPSGMLKALADAKTQLSKGQTGAITLPDDATDEQKAEWRKARDIPEAADAYDIAIKGIDWTDDDKTVIGEFAKAAHSLPVPLNNSQVKGVLQWYADTQIAENQEREVRAAQVQKQTVSALKAEYGGEYERNVSLIKEFGAAQLGSAEAWDNLVGAQLSDGTRLGDNPAFIRLIVDSALDRGDGLPFVGGSAAGGVSDTDLIKAHKELSGKAAAGDRDAKKAMADPDYEKKISAAYERQTRREESKRTAA